MWEDHPDCRGCGADCPHDWKSVLEKLKLQLKEVYESIARAKAAGKSDAEIKEAVQEAAERALIAAKRVFGSKMEFDHNDPLLKCRNVSDIYDWAEIMIEIALTTLRCIFCHRLKSYKYGDSIPVGGTARPWGERITKTALMNRLKAKLAKFMEQGRCCPGPEVAGFGGCVHDSLKSFAEDLTGHQYDSRLERTHLFMMLWDGDHVVLLEKLDNPSSLPSEYGIDNVVLRCCVCHGIRSMLKGDYAFRHWVILSGAPSMGGKPIAPTHEREVNGKKMTMWNMELRVLLFG